MPNQYTRNPKSSLQRFAEKCAFDVATGCVIWTGGTSAGSGHSQPYGRFWDAGEMWYAHRWAAANIHGFDITGLQVDHCCPCGPLTLCVQHVKPEPAEANRALQHLRPGRAVQSLATKQYWLFVAKGIEEYRPILRESFDIPFYHPPDWLRPYLEKLENIGDCPF